MLRSMKEKLVEQVTRNLGLLTPDRSNSGKYLWPIFYWQVISDTADKAFKEAWEAAVVAKVIGPDEKLRELGPGEHLLADSNSFSALVSVSKPRSDFDREAFIDAIAKKYKIERAKLVALASSCTKQGNSSLRKRVVEATK